MLRERMDREQDCDHRGCATPKLLHEESSMSAGCNGALCTKRVDSTCLLGLPSLLLIELRAELCEKSASIQVRSRHAVSAGFGLQEFLVLSTWRARS